MTSRLIRNMPGIVGAIRARIEELGLTYETVDAISGLPDRYTAKLMCGMRNPGAKAVDMLCGALALGFVAVVDDEQAASVSSRWVRRKRPLEVNIPRRLRLPPPTTDALECVASNPALSHCVAEDNGD